MTTAADIVSDAKSILLAGHPEALNKLVAGYGTTDTTFAFTYDMGGIQPGAFLGVDLELVYVWSVDQTAMTAVVERAQLGSTAAAHSSGATVQVNPLFSNWKIFNEINNDLYDLSSPANGLYRVNEVTVTFLASKYGYDIIGATNVDRILEVRYDPPGPAHDWPEILRYELVHNADSTDFPSGFGIVLKEDAFPGRDLRIVYASPLGQFTALTDDAQTVAGLPATANDVPALGAALALQGVREGQRNFNETEGDTRRAAEVPAGAQFAATRGLSQQRESRIRSESGRLNRRFPYKRKVA